MTRHTPEQVIAKLRQAEADLAQACPSPSSASSWPSASRPCTAGATSTAA
jgi:hypothetical protein